MKTLVLSGVKASWL